ncbi:glutamate receptor 2.1-like [Forsythia ovata]|uniref:Glutamate receptor 2.1-like n=1 Tax=Forsythia ovata TaxID=205694 RepID=A0ABD1SNL8_9LAMI
MTSIEIRNFGPGYLSDQDPFSSELSYSSLTTYDFGGLFIIFGSITVIALFCSETKIHGPDCPVQPNVLLVYVFNVSFDTGDSRQQGEEESSEPVHDKGANSFDGGNANVSEEPGIRGEEDISESG